MQDRKRPGATPGSVKFAGAECNRRRSGIRRR